MKEKFNKFIHSKYSLISLVVLLILLVIATGTYAWFTWRSTNNTSLTMNIGELANVIFNSGNDISTSTLAPVYNYTDGERTTFRINNRDTTGTSIGYSIKLNITSIASELKSTSLKYVLLKNDTIVQEGDFSSITTGSTTIYVDSISSSGTTNFIFYLYIDGNEENDLNMINKSLVGTLTVEATDKESFATYITNLYNNASKTTVTNNSITYQYDTTNSLMKDVGGNIRYYGAYPNNYILFNCSDYTNQSSCELWRIIGVFDGKVKLIRNSEIGGYPWDNKDTSTGTENDYGKNDWSDARLMKLLNPGYESETAGGSLYYNAKSGNCYSNTETCDFTSTGIKNDTTRNLIVNTTYYLGGTVGIEDIETYPNQMYEYERGTTVYSGNPTTWQGKIALPYSSDYGYAADLQACSKQLSNYNDSTCTSSNWMTSMMTQSDTGNWLLTTTSETSVYVWYIAKEGFLTALDGYAAIFTHGVAPVLYLNPYITIKSGTGEMNSPYQLQVS